jgi:hypothetical protein
MIRLTSLHPIATRCVVAIALLSAGGCAKQAVPGPSSSGTTADADHDHQLQALQAKRENYEGQLRAMDVSQLAATLAADSQKGREPFNSAAYRETITRGEAAAATLKPLLKEANRSSLLGLLALRQLSAAQYKSLSPSFRVNVLVGSLADSKFFNTWGVPNFYWTDAAQAIVDEGNAAVGPLTRLLQDTRPAPVFGSEGTEVNAQFHFRVCDYALALLNEIRHDKTPLAADVAARDQLIKVAAKKKP